MRWQDQLQEGIKLPERSGSLADDPFRGRHPTSHERMTGLPWDASYQDGRAPWDIGQPQPAIVRLASEGGFAGTVLDAGCGTGENALLVASLGLSVLGVDVAETALAIAREKASERGIEVEFAAADAFHLDRLGRMFDTVLDCGLFHTFDGDERPGSRPSNGSSLRGLVGPVRDTVPSLMTQLAKNRRITLRPSIPMQAITGSA